MNRYRLFALACLAGSIVGCSGPKEEPRGVVKGRVTIGEKPVSGATIVFENKAIGVSQTAKLDDDGKYEFTSYNATGLPPGSYKVAITEGQFMAPGEETPRFDAKVKAGAPQPKKPASSIPAKYTKADSSGLTAEVKVGDNPPFDFALKP